MQSLHRSNLKKLVLVISDLHLAGGKTVRGRRNPLEDFHYDGALIDFLQYYSSNKYEECPVELVINGDFLDFLAIPFVEFFDDEFWSEEASLEKLRIIMKAHRPVLLALKHFISKPHKNIVYIIGNHDAEFILDSLKEEFISFFGEFRDRVRMSNDLQTYVPVPGVYIQHGHQYEHAHDFDPEKSIVLTSDNKRYFVPSWGSYYVVNVINRYKQERSYINAIRPIKHFLIHGLIFDTFFTLRFILSHVYYFFMVRFWYYIMMRVGWRQVVKDVAKELTLFQDFDSLTRQFFQSRPAAKVLIVGHTHNPMIRHYSDGTTFINTGTWTDMVNLDLSMWNRTQSLTFASIRVMENDVDLSQFENQVEVDLKVWTGTNNLPYRDFN